ncbi:MAG: thrombospondin type 3 repeat-containing protein [Candidatus Pacebacteria bacterium]|nr:thrombospondin type 3 repeat-containing protein [Candidatus Paceibacterota bacterium]MCD8507812.1 thrombospondin type 3 repeat-containing protein [Candidatus Paceibacterota bacterium]MCD8528039.1 thrombospondin type 3 repeat-containing protein [Candidatus Paceibacterota bacterium]MCD8563880.1 thrombospondin type 3 repeat-containing protein [Candidatus Paceibacterota bacterium]
MIDRTKFLPSKEFIIRITVLGVLVLIGVVILVINQRKHKDEEPEVTARALSFENILALDTDGDGLPDWEEALWGMDPLNPDTSGNGIPDGEEVALIREAQRLENLALGIDVDTNPENQGDLTQSEILARQLYATLATMSVGGEISDDARADISFLIERSIQQPLLQENIRPENLTIVASNVTNNTAYFQVLSTILGRLASTESALVNLFQDIESRSTNLQARYGATAALYANIHKELIEMSVPAPARIVHARLATTTGNMALALEKITLIERDPLPAFQSFLQIDSLVLELANNLQDMSTLLRTLPVN